jgi:hypothetical protein
MASDTRYPVIANIQILHIKLLALDSILEPWKKDATSEKPYFNYVYVKEELEALSQASDALLHSAIEKDRGHVPEAVDKLERIAVLKTLFTEINPLQIQGELTTCIPRSKHS